MGFSLSEEENPVMLKSGKPPTRYSLHWCVSDSDQPPGFIYESLWLRLGLRLR
jgi:hypothetical protein